MKKVGLHNLCLLDTHNLQTILHQQVPGCSLGQSPHVDLHVIKGEQREESQQLKAGLLFGLTKNPPSFNWSLFCFILSMPWWKEEGIRNFYYSPEEQSLAGIVTV